MQERGLRGRTTWQAALPGLLAVALVIAGCGVLDAPPPRPTPRPAAFNLFVNPGFEDGSQPWLSFQPADSPPFSVSDAAAHSGAQSAHLVLEGDTNFAETRAAGATQEVKTSGFPEFVSGYYRVDSWDPQARLQYLEFVVRVSGADLLPESPTHDVRFLIAGAPTDPTTTPDVHLIFLSRAAPVIGKWTYFAYPIKRAFESRFDRAPARWDSLQVSFEARYDGWNGSAPAKAADVYFDDLYVGFQAGNPNRPDGP